MMMDEPCTAGPVGASKGGKKELDSIRIEPAKNGGHTVRHSYKSRQVYVKGRNGGMRTEYPESEEFVFGPDDGDKMMAHVAKHLGMKAAKEEAAEA